MSDRATATVTVYNGSEAYHVTAPIKREFAKGLTVETPDGVVYYAANERVVRHEKERAYLW